MAIQAPRRSAVHKELVVPRLLLPTVERVPDRALVVDDAGGHRATYAEHLGRLGALAGALRGRLGLGRADTFAVLAQNGFRYLELYHAAFFGAGIVVPLNTRLAAPELEHILTDSGARVLFADAAHLATARALRDRLPGVETVVLLGADGPDGPDGPDGADDADAVLTWAELLAGDDGRGLPEEPEEDDPALLLYTAGTTGRAKGVICDQRNLVLNNFHFVLGFSPLRDGVYLIQTPMFHVGSMGGIVGVAQSGGTIVTVPGFEAGAVLDACERHGVTATGMIPTMITMVLDHPAFRPERLGALRALAYGGAPMPVPLLERLATVLPQVELYQAYGMTESTALLSFLRPDDHRRGGARLRSVGHPVPGVQISIRDPEGRECGVGEVGEIWARGGNVMRGYLHLEEATTAALADGWYHTGDAGYRDGDAYLYIVDRIRDMIITGGENVFSPEVEDALAAHPAVAQVAVFGIPHELWGEAVHAVVVLRPDADATDDELAAHCRTRLANYKVPKTFEVRREPLPVSGAMKPLKRQLRTELLERLTPGPT